MVLENIMPILLELLTDDEMRFPTVFRCVARYRVKPMPEVDTKHTECRHKHTQAKACGTLQRKRVVFTKRIVRSTGIKERKRKYRRLRLKCYRVTKLERELVINSAPVVA